jgi:FkbM family methyltransferase
VIKQIIERVTGYWLYKTRYLPVGADLRIDFANAGLGKPDLIFDIGANVGQTYERFRKEFPDSRIVSFEPVKKTWEALVERLANDPNAKAEQLALGDASGTATIGVSDEWSVLNSLAVKNWATDVRQETIHVDTIDNYCSSNGIRRVDLLKIDTDGYDVQVMKGWNTVEVGAVFCEVGFNRGNDRNNHFADVADFLEARGFHFFGMYDVVHYPEWSNPSFANALFIPHP